MCAFVEVKLAPDLMKNKIVFIKTIFHGCQLKGSASRYTSCCHTALSIATPPAENKKLAMPKGAVQGRQRKTLMIYAVNFKENIATVFNSGNGRFRGANHDIKLKCC